MKKGMTTRLVHTGENELAKKIAHSVSVPKVLPIYMSSVFSFDDVPSLDGVYEGRESGYVYTRMSNPGVDAVKEILASAEESDGAVMFSSGMAAIITTILANVKAGDHMIASPVLYGGVYDYLKHEIRRFGVEVDFVDFLTEDIEKYVKKNTKIIYTETVTNPLMEVMDIQKISDIAHRHGAKLIVDNTFCTPAICRPMELGADIVVYSATKYLGGHSDIIGGAVTSTEEHLVEIQRLGTLYGGMMSPFDAWLLARSLRTLEMRMERHSQNAAVLAEYLANHPKAEKVYYPGLKTSPFYELGKKQFCNGWYGGMLSVDIAGGEIGASNFIANCRDIKFVPSLAGVGTSISYPAKTSHRAYTSDELAQCGISSGQLRISVGLEKIEDVIEEFENAFRSV